MVVGVKSLTRGKKGGGKACRHSDDNSLEGFRVGRREEDLDG